MVQQVYVSQAVKEYTVSVGRATRESPLLRLGASPRSMLQLLRAAKATAALDGRDFVLPDDVVDVAQAVLAHRIILDRKAAGAGETPHSVLRGILSRLPVTQPADAGNRAPAATGRNTPVAGLSRNH
jgi:MoxR-like ATPase